MNNDLLYSNAKFNRIKESSYFGLGSNYKSNSVNIKPRDVPTSAKFYKN